MKPPPFNFKSLLKFIHISLLKNKTAILETLLLKQVEFRFKKIKENHDQYLIKNNLPPQSLTKINNQFRRVNHCWNCKSKVDNNVDYECSGCGWIVCASCGACAMTSCGKEK